MPPALLFAAPSPGPSEVLTGVSVPATVIAALIGAVVAVLGFVLNDAFARYRSRAEWTREQLYATTTKLQAKHRDVQGEITNAPSLPQETVTAAKAQQFIDSYNWKPLADAMEGYRAGLDELALLLREPKMRQHITHMDVTLRHFGTVALTPYASYDQDATIHAQQFDFRMVPMRYHIAEGHESLIRAVTHRHFVGWKSRWAERHRDAQERRQHRRMERRVSS